MKQLVVLLANFYNPDLEAAMHSTTFFIYIYNSQNEIISTCPDSKLISSSTSIVPFDSCNVPRDRELDS